MSKPPLHVAILIDSWFPGTKRVGTVGGGQVHVKELTEQMSRFYPVKFTLFFPGYDNFFYHLFWPLIAYFRLLQTHRHQPFDLLHSHGLLSSFIARLAALTLKLPTIQTVHSYHHKLQLMAFTRQKFTAQISVSSAFLKHPNLNTHIAVIHNGVDTADFDAVTVDKYPNPAIIWVGRDDPSKGVTYLRQAIAKLRKKIPNLQAKLITGGDLTGKSLIKAYKRAHLFVLPSLAESQPISLLEAWAAKLPVVATSVGDNPHMIKDGVNGYLVEPGNASQLADAIHKILRARNKDIKMGEAGYQMVKTEYTWAKTAAATWEIYQEVLNNKS